jgi:glycosyltransferase
MVHGHKKHLNTQKVKSSRPFFTIITVCFNNEHTIENTILSVKNQKYRNFEYVIIDGASTDNTLKVISSYSETVDGLISERDKGIYDAMNKGLNMAKGDVIGFLHADDEFANELVLSDICENFKRNFKISATYGDLNYISNNACKSVLRFWKSCSFTKDLLKKGWMPPHPTLYIRRECFKKLKGFNTNYKISSDYDIILRFFSNKDYITQYIPKVLINMSVGGASNKSLQNIIQKSSEDFHILRSNGSSIISAFFTLLLKNFSKLHQFLH